MPKFSILCPSFNHEKYVGFFIQSLLNQTFKDFELIIVDDFSSDSNVAKIEGFKDYRIKLIKHSFNQGINASLNTAFKYSKGDFIIFIASDDMFAENALAILSKYFQDKTINIISPALISIDKDNKILNTKHQSIKLSRVSLLRKLFFEGNPLNSPGISMRREIFETTLYPLPVSLCNHQDTQMHINLLLTYDYTFIDEILIFYRRSENYSGISASNDSTYLREQLEIPIILDSFLKCENINLLKEVFSVEIKQYNMEPFKDTRDFFLGKMALLSSDQVRKIWGYHILMKAYNKNLQRLHEIYNFDFKSLIDSVNECQNDKIFTKYKKYKKIFNFSLILLIVLLILLLILGAYLWLSF